MVKHKIDEKCDNFGYLSTKSWLKGNPWPPFGKTDREDQTPAAQQLTVLSGKRETGDINCWLYNYLLSLSKTTALEFNADWVCGGTVGWSGVKESSKLKIIIMILTMKVCPETKSQITSPENSHLNMYLNNNQS